MESDRKILLKHGHFTIFDEHLGEGSFGEVFKGLDSAKHRIIAAKRITNSSLAFSQKEVDILLALTEHDNIVRIYDTFIREGIRWIVMQYCDGPTLEKYLEKENPSFHVRSQLIQQVIEGVQYMHNGSPAIAHRDLKPLNIIIVRGTLVKLCDFGLAREVATTKVQTFGGTIAYMAPELFKCEKYNPFRVDVFSAGLIILATFTFVAGKKMERLFVAIFGVSIAQQMLQPGNQNVLKKIVEELKYPCQQTMRIITLVSQMVSFKPQDRPDFNEVFHRFMAITKQADPGGARARTPAGAHSDGKTVTGDIEKSPSGVPAVPTSLKAITRLNLGFKASDIVGFGYSNNILLADIDSSGLVLYELTDGEYSQVWRKPVPPGMDSYCNKALSSTGEILLQQHEDLPTEMYSTHMVQQDTYKRKGRLLDWLEDGRVAYMRGTRRKADWEVDVYNSARKQPEMTLKHQAQQASSPGNRQEGWEHFISVCCVSDRVVVVERCSRSLDIFTSYGKHLIHKKLAYTPALQKAVTSCGSGHFMVAEFYPAAVHLYNAEGVETHHFTHKDLELEKEDVCVWGIRCSSDGVLHVATGGVNIDALRAYKLA